MGYVDLRRRAERRRGTRGSAGPGPRALYRLVALGFALGALATLLVSHVLHDAWEGPDPLATLLPLIAGLTILGYAGWRLRRRNREVSGPRFGGEKQLLLAMQSTGGSITPVEAALETSLTVDEAEEILTRFADRGHLLVEGRDGALYYTLPGSRTRRLRAQ